MKVSMALLEKAALRDQLTHCLLFHSGSRQEREEMGTRLAMILNCQGQQDRPCRECISCRKIASGNHPDISVIEPLKDTLRMEQVLAWQEKVYRKHLEGRYKVCRFEQADKLTVPAANALLKVLEEPPERTVIILSAENAEGVLPTLRSRAQAVYFPDIQGDAWLEKNTADYPAEAPLAWWLSGENPDVAARMLALGVHQIQEWLRQFWQAVAAKDFMLMFPLFEKGKGIERHQIRIYLQAIGMRIKTEIRQGGALPAALIAVDEGLEALRHNTSPRLVMEVLALKLMDLDVKRMETDPP
ncbi:MAG: DNA polymerase III subunit delta' [Peptococcaceae bacterium]|nr:DNA polymerase III subunit delta' [Peptococcaceae bacterium]